MTLHDRYPSDKHRAISTEFARRWMTFANGLPPWEEYEPRDQIIAVVDYSNGWSTKTRRDDEKQSSHSEEGLRRYEAWEAIHSILSEHGIDAQRILDRMKARSLMSLTPSSE